MKQKILKLNRRKKFGESDNNIRLDLQLSEKVDVINSKWMGYMLLHENMLGSVIIARDVVLSEPFMI
jgi:hypothetical protein